MSAAENEPPLGLGMDFNEAIRRFAKTDPKEIEGDKRLDAKRKNITEKEDLTLKNP